MLWYYAIWITVQMSPVSQMWQYLTCAISWLFDTGSKRDAKENSMDTVSLSLGYGWSSMYGFGFWEYTA
jgi:hypothetical protein